MLVHSVFMHGSLLVGLSVLKIFHSFSCTLLHHFTTTPYTLKLCIITPIPTVCVLPPPLQSGFKPENRFVRPPHHTFITTANSHDRTPVVDDSRGGGGGAPEHLALISSSVHCTGCLRRWEGWASTRAVLFGRLFE